MVMVMGRVISVGLARALRCGHVTHIHTRLALHYIAGRQSGCQL